jgi:hypothetical protein
MNDEDETADLDAEIAALLADPSMWAEPSADLEDRVAVGIAEERRVVVPFQRRSRQWPGRLAAAALGAAAAAGVVLTVSRNNDHTQQADARVALAGTDLATGVTGLAELTTETSGVRIEFSVPGLPRRDGGEFYEAWLKNCDGTALVPLGTYHELDKAVGWAGVALEDFAVLTVTREAVAAPKDAAQGTSGEIVVSGNLRACPT